MAEYIEREAAIEKTEAFCDVFVTKWTDEKVLAWIRNLPTADVVEVKHGRWEPVLDGVWNLPTPVLSGWRCSECGRTEQEKEPYCNCGARMDGEG